MTKLEECETALRSFLLERYGIGLTGDDLGASRAVLLALREPDAEMIEAAGDVAVRIAEDGANYIPGVTPDWDYGTAAIAQHEAMIDAALEDGK